jgi:hypothetical protein
MIAETPHSMEISHLSHVLYYQREQSFQDLLLACADTLQAEGQAGLDTAAKVRG